MFGITRTSLFSCWKNRLFNTVVFYPSFFMMLYKIKVLALLKLSMWSFALCITRLCVKTLCWLNDKQSMFYVLFLDSFVLFIVWIIEGTGGEIIGSTVLHKRKKRLILYSQKGLIIFFLVAALLVLCVFSGTITV